MGACKAYIKLEPAKDIYTAGDTLKGTVVVDQTKDLSVKQIVIKLKGKAKVTIGEGEYRSAMIATLFHEETQVFPPPHLAAQSMSRLTIVKGKYEYPFEFQIPGHGEGSRSILLPTFSIDFNRIFVRYYLKATVRRTSRLAVNTRAELDIRTTPCLDRNILNNFSLETASGSVPLISGFDNLKARLSDSIDVPVIKAELHYPKRGLRPSAHETLDLRLRVIKTGPLTQPIILTGVSIYLYRLGVFKTDVSEAKTREKVAVETLELHHDIDFDDEGGADVSDLISNIRLRCLCLPSFSSRLIDIQYEIGATISFHTERGKRKLDLSGRTTILPICIHQHNDGDDELPTYTHEDYPPEYKPDVGIPIYSS